MSVTVITVRVGIDGVYSVRLPQCRQTSLPLCKSCLALERRGIAEEEGSGLPWGSKGGG